MVFVYVAVAAWVGPDGFEADGDVAICVGELPAAVALEQWEGAWLVLGMVGLGGVGLAWSEENEAYRSRRHRGDL